MLAPHKWIAPSVAGVVLLALAAPLPAPLIYRPGQGWETEGKDSVAETSKEQLDRGEKYEKDGMYDEAAGTYRALVKTWPLSPNAPEAQYRYAAMLYKAFDFQRSFKEFQSCIDRYPDNEHFSDILKYQYDIACLFLAGERQKVWKIPTLPSMDKTVEMFEQVIKNGPYSPYAAMSQLKIGFARENQHKWDAAVKAYQDVIRKYPKSDLADDAQFQIGYAWMLAARQAEYDQTATNKAITAFEDYITRYPKSEKIEQARENIQKLRAEQCLGLMRVAEFYDAQRKTESALIYYNSVVQKYPGSDLARRAARRADEIRQGKLDPPTAPSPNTSTNAPIPNP
jgi:outer membrane protein assembly factor BamD